MTMSTPRRMWTQVLCIVHAFIVSAIWYVMFMLDRDIVKVRTWVALAILWLVWIFSVAFPGRTRRLRWVAVLSLGTIILSPTFSTLYTFAVWSIGGFAP
jgi:hypothetical protein